MSRLVLRRHGRPDTTRSVRIRSMHLNPLTQRIIGMRMGEKALGLPYLSKQPLLFGSEPNIRSFRNLRLFSEVLILTGIISQSVVGLGTVAIGIGIRAIQSYLNKRVCDKLLVESIRQNGLVEVGFEREYDNQTYIMNNYPVVHVNLTGDLILTKNNCVEHFMYKVQNGALGALGITLWRWRTHLKPPEVPELEISLGVQRELVPVRIRD